MKHVEVVCAIIENDKGEIFTCRRGPGRVLNGKWEFPGGKVEPSETHEQTVVREIKEELDSIIESICYLGKNYHEYKDIETPFSISLYAYKCKLIKGELKLSEHTDSKWVKPEELDSLDFAEADIPLLKLIKSSK